MKTKRASKNITNVQVGWPKVLADVEAEIGQAKARVKELRQSLKLIHKKMDAGEPFPEEIFASTHS